MYYYNCIYWNCVDIRKTLIDINSFIGDIFLTDLIKLFREHEDQDLNRTDINRKDIRKAKQHTDLFIKFTKPRQKTKNNFELICMLANNDFKFD